MTIRHVTSVDNVDDEGFLVDVTLAHHASLRLGRIEALAGRVDPLTHLNLDAPDHDLGTCLVAERLERGASMVRGPDGQVLRARPRGGSMTARGPVDLGARRTTWLRTLRRRREEGSHAGR